MPVSVCKKASANATTLQHVKNGVHHRDIFANQDGGPHMTSGIMTITKHESGGITFKTPCLVHVIVVEGEISYEDGAKPGQILVVSAGDVIRADKGTIVTLSSPSSGKGFYVAQREFGMDLKKLVI